MRAGGWRTGGTVTYYVCIIHYTALPVLIRAVRSEEHGTANSILLDPCGLAACSDPPVVPSGPLGVSPDPSLYPPILVVPLCPPVLLMSLLIPPRVLRCPWCLLDPTVV